MTTLTKRVTFCDEHNHAKNRMFCKSKDCWKFICQFCVETTHKDHDVVDLKTLSEQIQEIEARATQGRFHSAASLKTTLVNLEDLLRRVQSKHQQLFTEHEKTKYLFEKLSQRMSYKVDSSREELEKKAKRLAGKVETFREEIAKDLSKICGTFEAMKKTGTADAVKALYQFSSLPSTLESHGETLKEKIVDEAKSLEAEISGFEALTTTEFFPWPQLSSVPVSMSSTPANLSASFSASTIHPMATSKSENKALNLSVCAISPERNKVLEIQIPPGSARAAQANTMFVFPSPGDAAGTGRQKNVLDKLNGKIFESEGKLKSLDQAVELKAKELERLSKARAELVKANESLRLNLEKQNKVFAENLDAFVPTKLPKKSAGDLLLRTSIISPKKQPSRGSTSKITATKSSPRKMLKILEEDPEKSRILAAEKVLENALTGLDAENSPRTLEGMIKQLLSVCEGLQTSPRSSSFGNSPADVSSAEKEKSRLRRKVKECEGTIVELKKEIMGLQRSLKKTQIDFGNASAEITALKQSKGFRDLQQLKPVNRGSRPLQEIEERDTSSKKLHVKTANLEIVSRLATLKETVTSLAGTLRSSLGQVGGTMTALNVFLLSNRKLFADHDNGRKTVLSGEAKELIRKVFAGVSSPYGKMVLQLDKINTLLSGVAGRLVKRCGDVAETQRHSAADKNRCHKVLGNLKEKIAVVKSGVEDIKQSVGLAAVYSPDVIKEKLRVMIEKGKGKEGAEELQREFVRKTAMVQEQDGRLRHIEEYISGMETGCEGRKVPLEMEELKKSIEELHGEKSGLTEEMEKLRAECSDMLQGGLAAKS